MEKKKLAVSLVIIFLVALIVRVAFILTLDNSVDVWGDWWDELGWRLAQGHGLWVKNPYFPDAKPFYSWRTPGFPLFLAFVYRIFGHSFLAAKISLAVVSSVTSILMYPLCRFFFRNKPALMASWIYAIYPAAIFWTGYICPVTIEIFLLVSFTICLLTANKKGNRLIFFLSGLLLSMGILVRSVFVLLLPLSFLWLFIINRKNIARNFLMLLIGCMILFGPWIIRNFKIHKEIVLTSTEGGQVCYIANNPDSLSQPSGYRNPTQEIILKLEGLSETRADRYLYQRAFEFIAAHPGEYAKLAADRFIRFWRLYPHTFSGPGKSYTIYHVIAGIITFSPLIILGWLGLFFSFMKWRKFLWIYFVIGAFSIPTIFFFKTVIRYREPLAPLLIILAMVPFIKNVER